MPTRPFTLAPLVSPAKNANSILRGDLCCVTRKHRRSVYAELMRTFWYDQQVGALHRHDGAPLRLTYCASWPVIPFGGRWVRAHDVVWCLHHGFIPSHPVRLIRGCTNRAELRHEYLTDGSNGPGAPVFGSEMAALWTLNEQRPPPVDPEPLPDLW